MPVAEVEKILEANDHIIENFSWITASINNFEDSFVVKTHLDNLVNIRPMPIKLYATQPNYFETAETKYQLEYYVVLDEDDKTWHQSLGLQHPNNVATQLAEVLYTARGSQGLATFGWIDDTYSVWPLYDQPDRIENKEYGNFVMKLRMETDQYMIEYLQRALWTLEYCPGFNIMGRGSRKLPYQDGLISIPMYAKYARLRLDQVPMEKLAIKLKDPTNKSHIKFLKDALQQTLEQEGFKD